MITKQAQHLTEVHYEAMRKNCGHPSERKRQRYRRDGSKCGVTCLDCKAERDRIEYRDKKPARRQQQMPPRPAALSRNGGVAPPTRDVLAAALCGPLVADPRFIGDPKLLSDEDRVELAVLCGDCPVRQGCLEWATKDRYFIGVAGGYTFAREKDATRRTSEPLLKPVLTGYASTTGPSILGVLNEPRGEVLEPSPHEAQHQQGEHSSQQEDETSH